VPSKDAYIPPLTETAQRTLHFYASRKYFSQDIQRRYLPDGFLPFQFTEMRLTAPDACFQLR
jgi:hypothetical protein